MPPQDTADVGWLSDNRLSKSELAGGGWKTLPQAELLRIEARTEFDRMDPMNVVATPEEVARIVAGSPTRSYLLFPEDRKFPVWMKDDIPLKWAKSGPS